MASPLEVVDNGRGFDVASVAGEHDAGLDARADAYRSAPVAIESRRGAGTRVAVELALKQPASRGAEVRLIGSEPSPSITSPPKEPS